ncbi:MAG: NAD(P)-binding domain-containing protein [Rhizobiaceae bacterium]|nr:NAD(P)-binding domain-containing protein [Rhizobiaceae bacterium]
MTTVALIGAGGKMGYRLAGKLKESRFTLRCAEVSDAGKARLSEGLRLDTMDMKSAISGAEIVILAVPDTAIGKVSNAIEKDLKPGTMLVILDVAAPFAGHLPKREDLTIFVTHPCHPPIFNDETDLNAKRDFFGGVAAKQHIVSALMQGPEEHYELGEEIATIIWAPVMRSHRITVDQMAMLEPGLSETLCASLLVVMREAMDEVVSRGVPKQAARDFLLGHMNVLGAVIFEETPGVFSDACNKAIEFGKPMLMRDDWKRIFDPQELADSIRRIT